MPQIIATPLAHLLEQMKQIVTAEPTRWHPLVNPLSPLPKVIGLGSLVEKTKSSVPSTASPPVLPTDLQSVLGKLQSGQPGLVDFSPVYPNLRIAGPVRSGKTTALYNQVLSLALRYSPAQVGFVLVDLLDRFVTYGGQHSLATLPHTLAAVSTLKELSALLPKLEQVFAHAEARPAIFIVIDDYDDFSEELSNDYTLSEQLTDLVRAYGREGLHFMVAGSLNRTSDKLYSRIRPVSTSLALRDADTLERLEIANRGSQLIKKDLVVGRGYLAQGESLHLVQLAFPNQNPLYNPQADTQDIQVADYGIDPWVDEICETWPTQSTLELLPELSAGLAEDAQILPSGMGVETGVRFG